MIKSSSESCSTNTCDVGALTRCDCAPASEPSSAASAGKAAVAVSGATLAACVACCTLPFALPVAALLIPSLAWPWIELPLIRFLMG